MDLETNGLYGFVVGKNLGNLNLLGNHLFLHPLISYITLYNLVGSGVLNSTLEFSFFDNSVLDTKTD